MIVTIRTVPRSDGRTSVVITRDPAQVEDPEVVAVLENSREAVRRLLDIVGRISTAAHGRLSITDGRFRIVRTDLGVSWARYRLTVEMNDGDVLLA